MQLQDAVVVLPSTNRTNWYYTMALPKIRNTYLSAFNDVKLHTVYGSACQRRGDIITQNNYIER